MNKLLITFVILTIIGFNINQSTALIGGELKWIFGYENTTTTNEVDITSPITHEYTCPTDYFEVYPKNKYAECLEQYDYYPNNDSWTYKLVFGHRYNYGYKPNKTIYWIVNEKTGTYIDYINTSKQVRIGARKDNRYLMFADCNIMCGKVGDIVSCDSCKDGNCDGILQSGESGFNFNINNVNWHDIKIKSDSVWYKKLRGCIVKNE